MNSRRTDFVILIAIAVAAGVFGCQTTGPSEPKTSLDAPDRESDRDVASREGRTGSYVTEELPDSNWSKEKTWLSVVRERTSEMAGQGPPRRQRCEFIFEVQQQGEVMEISQHGLLPSEPPETVDHAEFERLYRDLSCVVPDVVVSQYGAILESNANELEETIQPVVRDYYDHHPERYEADLGQRAMQMFNARQLNNNAEWWWELLTRQIFAFPGVASEVEATACPESLGTSVECFGVSFSISRSPSMLVNSMSASDEYVDDVHTDVEYDFLFREDTVPPVRIHREASTNFIVHDETADHHREIRGNATTDITIRQIQRSDDSELENPAGSTSDANTESRDIIRSVVRSNRDAIRWCYESVLVDNPQLEGTVTMTWRIGPDGKVLRAEVEDTTLDSPRVEQCVVDEIMTWEFPPPAAGGLVEVNYPFHFSSE